MKTGALVLALMLLVLSAFLTRQVWLPETIVRVLAMSGGMVAGDEITGDLGYIAAVATGGRRSCAVIDQVEAWSGSVGNDVVLDGYLRGLVANDSEWIVAELAALALQPRPEWARKQLAWALERLALRSGTIGDWPSMGSVTSEEVERIVEAARGRRGGGGAVCFRG